LFFSDAALRHVLCAAVVPSTVKMAPCCLATPTVAEPSVEPSAGPDVLDEATPSARRRKVPRWISSAGRAARRAFVNHAEIWHAETAESQAGAPSAGAAQPQASMEGRAGAAVVAAAASAVVVEAEARADAEAEGVDTLVVVQIDADIRRTDGGDVALRGGLAAARAMLLKHAAYDPELGYCQGMNMVAALFAVSAGPEGDAYSRLEAFFGPIRGIWLPGFPLLRVGMAQFAALAQNLPWFQHLDRHGVEPEVYLPQAWMTAFATWLPLPTRLLLLGLLEQHGLSGLLATATAVLESHSVWLLSLDDAEDLLIALGSLTARPLDASALLAASAAWLPAAAAATASVETKVGATPASVTEDAAPAEVLDDPTSAPPRRRRKRLAARASSLGGRLQRWSLASSHHLLPAARAMLWQDLSSPIAGSAEADGIAQQVAPVARLQCLGCSKGGAAVHQPEGR